MREKIEIKYKINIFYYSKLKYDVIGRKIRRKTLILIQDNTQNDQIDCQIKGFSFCIFEDDRQRSRSNISLFSPRNLTFKHSLDAEIDLEDKESKRLKDWDI